MFMHSEEREEEKKVKIRSLVEKLIWRRNGAFQHVT